MKKSKKKIIRLRGHHLSNLRCECIGLPLTIKEINHFNPPKKHGENFAENTIKIMQYILNSETDKNILLQITDSLDGICRHCKRRRRWECCRPPETDWRKNKDYNNTQIDRQTACHFGLEINKSYRVKDISKILKKKKDC